MTQIPAYDYKTGVFVPAKLKEMSTKLDRNIDYSFIQAVYDIFRDSQSVVDLGCGTGHYCNFLKDNGIPNVLGIEGSNIGIYPNIQIANLTEQMNPTEKFDLVLCIEVGEHIPQNFEQIFIDNVAAYVGQFLVLSWAKPYQGGMGHVNCQPQTYLKEQFESRGFKYHQVYSNTLKNLSVLSWLRENVMVFEL